MNITAHADGNTAIFDGDIFHVRVDPVLGSYRGINIALTLVERGIALTLKQRGIALELMK